MALRLNPFTGNFDFVGSASSVNFSYHHILSGISLDIESNQHMIVAGELFVEGELNLNGYIVFSDLVDTDTDSLNFSFKESETPFSIPNKQEMILTSEFIVNAELNNQGTMSLILTSYDEFLPKWNVLDNDILLIKSGREMSLHGELVVDGEIQVQGRLIVLQ